ncbi:hypothetical protein HanPI659440_Chr16g0643141 [Helianthus annuus]|nr:hypothetical protein HanPI659440_Chr16g0643141 [Helianthus annuus]
MTGICRSSIPPLKRRSPIFFTYICRDLQFHLRTATPSISGTTESGHRAPLHTPLGFNHFPTTISPENLTSQQRLSSSPVAPPSPNGGYDVSNFFQRETCQVVKHHYWKHRHHLRSHHHR